jgi:hypothetical protein
MVYAVLLTTAAERTANVRIARRTAPRAGTTSSLWM